MPDTVQAVLAARIDLLSRTEKAALQTAAVIGRVFWSGPVCDLVEGADPEFGLLQERDFVLPHARLVDRGAAGVADQARAHS